MVPAMLAVMFYRVDEYSEPHPPGPAARTLSIVRADDARIGPLADPGSSPEPTTDESSG